MYTGFIQIIKLLIMSDFFERCCIIGSLFASLVYNVNCGNSGGQHVNRNDTIRIDGCKGDISTSLGSIVEISLPAYAGSGNQWLFRDSSRLLQLVDGENLKFINPKTDPPTPGLPGRQL